MKVHLFVKGDDKELCILECHPHIGAGSVSQLKANETIQSF